MLNIIIIGSCASHESKGQTPLPDDVDYAIKIADQRKLEVKVYLVDPVFKRYLRKLEDETHVVDDLEELDRVKQFRNINGVFIIDSFYEDWDKPIFGNNHVMYLNYMDNYDCYELMTFINDSTTKIDILCLRSVSIDQI